MGLKLVERASRLPGSLNVPENTISGIFKLSGEAHLRKLIRDAADQLCQVVDGNLDFVVGVSEADDDIDKLLLLVNFVMASARRSFSDLQKVHARMEEELAAARKLQEKLLPQKLPRARNLRVGTNFVPARAVGGDFFDFLRYRQNGLYVGVLADVSGKGVAAAIYAALASGIMRSLVEDELNPDEMLKRMNESLFTRAPEGQFVALTYSTWDDENLVLETCNSGLPEPFLCRNGSVQNIKIHGLPLGLFPEAEYESVRIQCEPGDTLVFYTDGIIDAVDPEGKDFGVERLGQVILSTCNLAAREIVDRVVHEASAHCRCETNFDDQTVVALRVL
jgi:sigma-B regulation protein RsbU (phosphoserine phosphatase)